MSTKIERRKESLLGRLTFRQSVRDKLREKIEWMLSDEGTKSYTIGSRSKENYDFDLSKLYEQLETVEDEIEKLEDQLEELEAGKLRTKRKAIGVIPCDRC